MQIAAPKTLLTSEKSLLDKSVSHILVLNIAITLADIYITFGLYNIWQSYIQKSSILVLENLLYCERNFTKHVSGKLNAPSHIPKVHCYQLITKLKLNLKQSCITFSFIYLEAMISIMCFNSIHTTLIIFLKAGSAFVMSHKNLFLLIA